MLYTRCDVVWSHLLLCVHAHPPTHTNMYAHTRTHGAVSTLASFLFSLGLTVPAELLFTITVMVATPLCPYRTFSPCGHMCSCVFSPCQQVPAEGKRTHLLLGGYQSALKAILGCTYQHRKGSLSTHSIACYCYHNLLMLYVCHHSRVPTCSIYGWMHSLYCSCTQ